MWIMLDDQGDPDYAHPVSLDVFLAWYEQNKDRADIGQTKVGPYLVSTKYFGMCLTKDASGCMHVWETMIFGQTPLQSWRYTSRAEAQAGHERAVQIAGGLG